jgi:hypothetical protein
MEILKKIALWSIPMILIACEETTEWQLDPGTNGQLAVQAILTDENKIQEIRLTQTYDELNGSAPPITDAVVSVEANGISMDFLPDQQDAGWYKSARPFALIDDLEYTLMIDWQGQRYIARSELAEVAPLPPITFQNFGKSDSLTFAEFAPIYNPNQQAMYEMRVDWSHLSSNPSDRALLYFYTFSAVEISSLVRPVRDTVFFPRGSVIIARKFGLSDDYADYLRALVAETEWRGGAFFGASASLPTNISEGAVGFFSASAIAADTLIAE